MYSHKLTNNISTPVGKVVLLGKLCDFPLTAAVWDTTKQSHMFKNQRASQNQEAVSEITINMHVKVEFPNFLDLDSQVWDFFFSFLLCTHLR